MRTKIDTVPFYSVTIALAVCFVFLLAYTLLSSKKDNGFVNDVRRWRQEFQQYTLNVEKPTGLSTQLLE